MLGEFDQVVYLLSACFLVTDRPVQDVLVEDQDDFGRVLADQNLLTFHPCGDQMFDRLWLAAGREHLAGVLRGLEEAGDDHVLEDAHHRRLGL
ncbi:hypothetical protein NDW01_12005 [Actinoallomurus sp. WRP6H-15]|nr:hypothetical protein [Actinoallomurus soli]MCO5969119.1 hypothetical protein [Actinoallomurus soli]